MVDGSIPSSANGGEGITEWRSGLACRAHNPKVDGSNPSSVNGGEVIWTGSRAVKGGRLKIYCDMLRGFESHLVHIVFS